MTWTKLGDEFIPEVIGLSDAAGLLHVKALCWSSWRLLDLVIPRRDLALFGTPSSASTADAVGELIETGWWQQIDDDTYWIGCKFAEWQRDKVQVEHRRAQLALAQRRKRRHDLDDHTLCIPGRCKAMSTVESSVESTVERADDPGRLRDGSVTGNPTTKPSLEGERLGTGPATSNGRPRCEECGSFGPLRLDEFGVSVCVGRCVQEPS